MTAIFMDDDLQWTYNHKAMKIRYLVQLSRFKNARVFVVSMLLGLVILGLLIAESYYSYRSEIKSAEIQSANLSRVLEEQISASFRMIDIGLLELQDLFLKENNLNRSRSKIYNQWLRTIKDRIPGAFSFKAADENGEYIGDESGTVPTVNSRDREYFQYFKQGNKNELFISKPILGKIYQVWIIVLARPILDKNGKFKGLVQASIRLDHIMTLFDSLNVGRNGIITFSSFDQYFYARKPWLEKYFGKRVEMSEKLVSLIHSDRTVATEMLVSKVDGTERIVNARKMSGYPFLVVTGLALDDFLVSWKARTIISFVIVVILFLAFAFFLLNFLKSLDQIEEQRKQAIQSAKLSSLGEMASGIAHEINNPLTIISALALSQKRPKAENENDVKLNDSLDRIVNTVERIAKIIRGLRTFSRDSYADPAVPTSVQSILMNTLDLCKERIKHNDVELKIMPFNDQLVLARDVQISQVVMNLLCNSMDAIEGSDKKWISISVESANGMVSIRITDSGVKPTDAIADKIMQPFFTTKPIGKGTGLGLSISRGIIVAHNGRFYLDRKAVNTSFVIELPMVS